MNTTMTTNAYAKINLYLDVTGRLENGYHTIRSVIQQVSLYDVITVEKSDAVPGERTIHITCTEPSIPTDGKNIVHKCAAAFFAHFGMDSYRISIHIDKRIPHAAGLAGGSTDGAAVLRILPELYGIKTYTDTLCAIGSKVGADIPFCIVGGTCLAEGIGEKLSPVKRNFASHLLIAIGGEGISTPEAYGRIDRMYADRFQAPEAYGRIDRMYADRFQAPEAYGRIDRMYADRFVDSWAHAGDLGFLGSSEIPTELYNIFESVILPTHPTACWIKTEMLNHGAGSALMSGSGPSVFGLFASSDQRDAALRFFTEQGIRAYSCEFIN